jgi:hypothetical protein
LKKRALPHIEGHDDLALPHIEGHDDFASFNFF